MLKQEEQSMIMHVFIILWSTYINSKDKMIWKIWLFPNIYDNASQTLSGAWNGKKRGFYSIFVVGGTKIRIQKFVCFAFLGLKWL